MNNPLSMKAQAMPQSDSSLTNDTPSPASHRRKVFFDPTVNLGHVLTFLGFMIAGFSAYSSIDKRVTLIEQTAVITQERTRERDGQVKETLAEVKGDVKDVSRTLSDVQRTVESISAQQPSTQQ